MLPDQKPTKKALNANAIVEEHALIGAGVGLIPVPMIDLFGVGANRFWMLSKLSNLYGVKYQRSVVRASLASMASLLSAHSAISITASLIKTVPVVGYAAGSLAVGTYAGASTYAIGQIFVAHFEEEGSFLDFDPQLYKDRLMEEFNKGIKFVRQQKNF